MEHIRVVCTNCGRKLKAPASAAGKKAVCPTCGTTINLPPQPSKRVADIASTPPPIASAAPNTATGNTKICPYCGEEIKQVAIVCRFCKMNLTSGNPMPEQNTCFKTARSANQLPTAERTVWEGNPTHLAYIPLYVFSVLLIPLFLIGIPLLIWAILDRKNTSYTVTNKRVTQKRGIIGKNISEINLKDIRNVIVQYGVIERILGYGNVGLATAGHAGIEINIRGCSDPEGIKKMIVDLKDRVR